MAAAPYLRILTVNIYVRDRERSLEFYRDRLGFSLLSNAGSESTTHWLAVAPPDGTAILTLIAPPADSDEYKFIGRSGQVVFVTEDLPAKFQEWSARGVPFHHPPQTRPWGGLFTTFEDPDGNSFTLVSHDRVSRQVEAQRRVAQEREFAKQVQARLFPQTLPPLATLDYAGVCVQARQVGGDYYDFLELGPDRLGIVIGDVAGKGMAAALLMANLQASLRGRSAIAANQPRRFLESVNQLFFENSIDSAYATLFFAEYHDRTRLLRYANCGHLAGFLFRAGDALERLDSNGTVLGLFKEWDCAIDERVLFPGDTLALYTDGLVESFNDAGEEFGEQRLIEALSRHRHLPSRDLLEAVLAEVRQFSSPEQYDDLTLIVATCHEK
jgi:serine phosphatase RsbU (regulator of sigma subunit)/predicted enzyme related to lactoylglutathione lyase